MHLNSDQLKHCIRKLENWIEKHDYKGYEPFDGLSSVLRPLTFNNLLLERVLQQLVRQSPVNIRTFVGIKPLESTKGRGYIAWGYLTRYKSEQKKEYKKKAVKCLDWLDKNKSPYYKHHSWGNHFDYASRFGRLHKYEPTIVWTGLIGQVFLDAYELFDDDKYLGIADSICKWITALPREKSPNGTCISYVALDQRSIHNSNMIGAAMLARTASFTGNHQYSNLAKEAMRYSCNGQIEDGAWYYGEATKYHWIDNFHTGYNLDSLKRYIDYTDDNEFTPYLEKGYSYFKSHFFREDGLPKYYHNRIYPIDIQCASQAIDTLMLFSDIDSTALKLANQVASWTIANMQSPTGYFYYRKYPLLTSKAPMIHWGQATMFKALTELVIGHKNVALDP